MRVVYWGTYDTGKPRNRIMIRGLRENGVQVIECHANVWKGIEDKSQIEGMRAKVRCIVSLLLAYPLLIYRYFRLPPHDIIVLGYMGLFDAIVIWPFARLRHVPVCWDVFLSLYDTSVIDRRIISEKSTVAFLLYALEWIASRAASQLVLDTRSHAAYFEKLYRLPSQSLYHVYLGAESEVFRENRTVQKSNKVYTVLFYGQFIPLHGIDTIVYAAKIVEKSGRDVRWILIGEGQEQPRIDVLIKDIGVKSIRRISWVRYDRLIDYINEADVCLGIFGASGKATRVIPNKVYQIIAAGKPLITGDTPAVRELLVEGPTVRLVEPGNPGALASAVLHLRKTLENRGETSVYPNKLPVIGYVEVGKQLIEVLESFRRQETPDACPRGARTTE